MQFVKIIACHDTKKKNQFVSQFNRAKLINKFLFIRFTKCIWYMISKLDFLEKIEKESDENAFEIKNHSRKGFVGWWDVVGLFAPSLLILRFWFSIWLSVGEGRCWATNGFAIPVPVPERNGLLAKIL